MGLISNSGLELYTTRLQCAFRHGNERNRFRAWHRSKCGVVLRSLTLEFENVASKRNKY